MNNHLTSQEKLNITAMVSYLLLSNFSESLHNAKQRILARRMATQLKRHLDALFDEEE